MPPLSGWMKPKPFWLLNHLAVPEGKVLRPGEWARECKVELALCGARCGLMDHVFQRHLRPLKSDLVVQMARVRELREIVAALAETSSEDDARLQDAEATLAVYTAEVVRLEKELRTVTVSSPDPPSAVSGVELPDQPMPVLQHQLSHAKPRPYARDRPERKRTARQNDGQAPRKRDLSSNLEGILVAGQGAQARRETSRSLG